MEALDAGNNKELVDDGIEGISITTLQEGCVLQCRTCGDLLRTQLTLAGSL